MGHPHYYDVKPCHLSTAWDLILVEELRESRRERKYKSGVYRLNWRIYQGRNYRFDPTRRNPGLDLLAKAQSILDPALLWALKHGRTRLCPHQPGWLWSTRAFVAFDVEFHWSSIACGPSLFLERCDLTYCGFWPFNASQLARAWCDNGRYQTSERFIWLYDPVRAWNATDLHR